MKEMKVGSFPVAWGIYAPVIREEKQKHLQAALEAVGGFVRSGRPGLAGVPAAPAGSYYCLPENKFQESWVLNGPAILKFRARLGSYQGKLRFLNPVMWVENLH